MRFLKYTFPIALVLLFALAAAACAQAPDIPTTTGGGSTATVAPSSATALIHTASVSVKGTSKTVLTNAQGLTLYYFTPDNATTSNCTGGCAGTWPALIATGSPTSSPTLSGTLEAHTTPNGNQVQYNKHFLYTFSGDSAPGQANGEGISGKWFVATPDLK